MSITTVSSREFNQDVGKAKRAATKGPVFITVRGHAEHVLLSIDDYEKMSETQKNIVELLAAPENVDIEFEPPRLNNDIYRPADLS